MAKMCLKKPSKRVTVKKRNKIVKKMKEHSRKLRKEAKKTGGNRKVAKALSVPNSCPFKEELLQQAEKTRETLEEERMAKKEELAELQRLAKTQKRKLETATLPDLVARASKASAAYEKKANYKGEDEGEKLSDKSVRAYAADVRRTIETADVVFEVLDARDPLGSRSKTVEDQVLNSGKRLVLILNKIDLVPKENVLAWMAYLRTSLPTIAFKASTQEQKKNLSRFTSSNVHASDTSKCIGADLVMKLLGNYCRNRDIKTSIRVGIVGYPNVGKSSLINSLKRERACCVGAQPGITRQIQEVDLDSNIRLIDSPGVVLASKKNLDAVECALKNTVRLDNLADPIAPVQAILRRCSKETLMTQFNLPDFNDVEHFLALISRKIGRLRKGGRPNFQAAAKHVLNYWYTGKLRYYTQVPEEMTSPEDQSGCTTEIVSQFSKEFDIDSLDADIHKLVESMPDVTDAMVYDTSDVSQVTEFPEDEEDSDEEMETEGGSRIVTSAGPTKKRAKIEREDGVQLPDTLNIEGNAQLNRAIKNAIKKKKRADKKTATRADALVDAMDIGMTIGKQEDYDYNDAMA